MACEHFEYISSTGYYLSIVLMRMTKNVNLLKSITRKKQIWQDEHWNNVKMTKMMIVAKKMMQNKNFAKKMRRWNDKLAIAQIERKDGAKLS